jgi:hypothetical protein
MALKISEVHDAVKQIAALRDFVKKGGGRARRLASGFYRYMPVKRLCRLVCGRCTIV